MLLDDTTDRGTCGRTTNTGTMCPHIQLGRGRCDVIDIGERKRDGENQRARDQVGKESMLVDRERQRGKGNAGVISE